MGSFKEFDLEEAIWTAWKTGGEKVLRECGLYLSEGKMFRQYGLGKYGVIDLLHVSLDVDSPPGNRDYRYLAVTGIELKAGTIGYTEIAQAARYLKALNLICRGNGHSLLRITRHGEISVCVKPIGSALSHGDECYIAIACDNIEVYSYSLDLTRGIRFMDESGWRIVDEDCAEQRKEIAKTIRLMHRDWYGGELLLRSASDIARPE